MFCEYFTGRPYLQNTHEILQAGITLHLPIMCSTCGYFAGKLLVKHLQNPLFHPFKLESSHSLILIPYNVKPTYIQGNMIEEIIIKFGKELKPTQNSCKLQLYKVGYEFMVACSKGDKVIKVFFAIGVRT